MRALLAALSFLLVAMPAEAAGVSMSGVVGALVTKANEIVSACGSVVLSGVRRGAVVAGTHHASLHASGHAIDIRGNPSCIYGRLRNWSGGVSTDYGSVQHVHFSLGGREDGLRFRHGSHRRHASRHRHGRHLRRNSAR